MRPYVDTSFQAKHQRVWLHFGYQCWLAVPTAHFFPDGTHTILLCSGKTKPRWVGQMPALLKDLEH